MVNLANYYEEIEQDYEQSKKYYLMAIENNDTEAMFNLACYYQLFGH
jgi:TPR repeat protein